VNSKHDTLTLLTFTDKSLSCSGFSDFERAKDMLMSLHHGNNQKSVEKNDKNLGEISLEGVENIVV